MDVRLRVLASTDRQAEVVSLRRWLSNEPEFRGRVSVEYTAPKPGEMGEVADVLIVALGSGAAVTALLSTLRTWIETRRSELYIETELPDGSIKRISARGPAADVLAEYTATGANRVDGQ